MSEPIIMHVAPPPPRTRRRDHDDAPSVGALIAAPFYAIDAMVIGGTTCPGLLLCVPAILLVIAPVVLVGAVLVLAAVALAAAAAPVAAAATLAARLRERSPAGRGVRVDLTTPAGPAAGEALRRRGSDLELYAHQARSASP